MKRLILGIIIGALVQSVCLLGCGDDGPNQPNDPVQTEIPYRAEAERAALYYSGEFRPPEDLTRTIGNELDLIRRTWGDSIPEVMSKFQAPWFVSSANVWFDDTAFSNIIAGNNPTWDSLILSLGATYNERFMLPGWLHVETEIQSHPIHIGERLAGFPGAKWIGSEEVGQPYWHLWVRSGLADSAVYYFQTYCQPVLDLTHHRFVIDQGKALRAGRHAECFEGIDTIAGIWPWDSLFAFLEVYEDSVEASKPSWVDSSRLLRRRLGSSPQFRWSRGE